MNSKRFSSFIVEWNQWLFIHYRSLTSARFKCFFDNAVGSKVAMWSKIKAKNVLHNSMKYCVGVFNERFYLVAECKWINPSMSFQCWIYHFEPKGTQSADAHVYFIPFLSWFGWFANNNNNNNIIIIIIIIMMMMMIY